MQNPARSIRLAPAFDPVRKALGDHVRACQRAQGRAFGLRCLGEVVHGLLGPRLFTTVFGAAALMTLLAGCA